MRVAVLASGRGSNLGALIDACKLDFPARIEVVASNVADAGALDRARAAGIRAVFVDHRGVSREVFERRLLDAIGDVDAVCLAGFMRMLTSCFLDAFPHRVLNVHPALLPAFPGTHGVSDALAHGVTQAGATVHLVDAGVDTGPILAQGSVAVRPDDTVASLAARILAVEHRLYPLALRWIADNRVRIEARRAIVDLRPGEERWIVGA